MTHEEAIEQNRSALKNICEHCHEQNQCSNCYKKYFYILVEEALEKQIPKKPSFEHTVFGECQSCKNPIDRYKPAYCCVCGQALNWEN